MFMYGQVLLFCIILAGFAPNVYSSAGYSTAAGMGVFFVIAAQFRFYFFSFWVADVRMAQTIYFYGTLGAVFIVWTLWTIAIFDVEQGNAAAANAYTGFILTLLEPSFGWFVILLFQYNVFGVQTLNPGTPVLTLAGTQVEGLVIGCIIYPALLAFREGALDVFINPIRNIFCKRSPAAPDASYASRENSSTQQPPLDEEDEWGYVVTTDKRLTSPVAARTPPTRKRGR